MIDPIPFGRPSGPKTDVSQIPHDDRCLWRMPVTPIRWSTRLKKGAPPRQRRAAIRVSTQYLGSAT